MSSNAAEAPVVAHPPNGFLMEVAKLDEAELGYLGLITFDLGVLGGTFGAFNGYADQAQFQPYNAGSDALRTVRQDSSDTTAKIAQHPPQPTLPQLESKARVDQKQIKTLTAQMQHFPAPSPRVEAGIILGSGAGLLAFAVSAVWGAKRYRRKREGEALPQATPSNESV
jgi:hypothetical protein